MFSMVLEKKSNTFLVELDFKKNELLIGKCLD